MHLVVIPPGASSQPHVHLGDLEGLSARKVVTPIEDDDVRKEIDRYRERAATYEATEEGAQDEDRVRAVVLITAEGEEAPDLDTVEPTLLQVGSNLEEFDAGIRGIRAGEERSFEFTYPEEADEERKGKKATVETLAASSTPGAQKAMFDDTNPDAFYSADNPLGGVKVAGHGVNITVTSQNTGGTMTISVVNPAE